MSGKRVRRLRYAWTLVGGLAACALIPVTAGADDPAWVTVPEPTGQIGQFYAEADTEELRGEGGGCYNGGPAGFGNGFKGYYHNGGGVNEQPSPTYKQDPDCPRPYSATPQASVGSAGDPPPEPEPEAEVLNPDDDLFYDQPSQEELEQLPNGAILRSRQVTITGLGVPLPANTAWQLFYRSNDSKNRPIAAMATVLVPLTPYAAGERPLVSYQMAIDSLGSQCNPAYTMRTGTQKELPVVFHLLSLGWAVVVPDFEGSRNAYGAGLVAAHTVLDGVRAATGFEPAGLAGDETPIGMWGYSGGGQATAWAAEQQPAYAPELNIAGIAEGGVPADVERVLRNLDGGPFFGVYFAASVGTSREFPEGGFDSILNDAGRALRDKIGKECAEQLITGYPNHHMSEYTTVPDPLAVPSLRAVLEANDLGKATPTAPVFIYHTVLDELIPVAGPDALVKKYCNEGAEIFYQRDAAGEHIAYAFTGGGAAVGYLAERFAGGPVATNCGVPNGS